MIAILSLSVYIITKSIIKVKAKFELFYSVWGFTLGFNCSII